MQEEHVGITSDLKPSGKEEGELCSLCSLLCSWPEAFMIDINEKIVTDSKRDRQGVGRGQ